MVNDYTPALNGFLITTYQESQISRVLREYVFTLNSCL